MPGDDLGDHEADDQRRARVASRRASASGLSACRARLWLMPVTHRPVFVVISQR